MSEDRKIRRDEIPEPRSALDISPADFDDLSAALRVERARAEAAPTPEPKPIEWLIRTGMTQHPIVRSWVIALDREGGIGFGPATHLPASSRVIAHCRALALVGGAEALVQSLIAAGIKEGEAEAAIHKLIEMIRAPYDDGAGIT